MRKLFLALILLLLASPLFALPKGFVYLSDVEPSIIQEMRYVGSHNFLGRPLKGYQTATCILTTETAKALAEVQKTIKPLGLSLKVYDCYRPKTAVDDIIVWSKDPHLQQMKAEFYPRVNKADFFKLGYVAEKSGHTRGSTVDLTLVRIKSLKQATYRSGDRLSACYAPYAIRFHDNSIDMGTGFDCMDLASHPLNQSIAKIAFDNRMILRNLMIKAGFMPIEEEWWHFTLKNEPFPTTYFDFPVKSQQ